MKHNPKSIKVLVALSGGTDSAVSLYSLLAGGNHVEAAYITTSAYSGDGLVAAQEVCRFLSVKLNVLDAQKEFKKHVIDYFIESYRSGLTPNPCTRCNEKIKFGPLLKFAIRKGFDKLATGHYARIDSVEGVLPRYRLLKAADHKKDQSYFLYHLKQKHLERIIFPIGRLEKQEVRQIATNANLPCLLTESQDICFLQKEGKSIDHNILLKQTLSLAPGPIITLDGQIVGLHEGLPLYTTGQRRGIRIGGTGPYYAVRKDPSNNTLLVTSRWNDKSLYTKQAKVGNFNWTAGPQGKIISCMAVFRYQHQPVPCRLHDLGKGNVRAVFREPQRAVAPGQCLVAYAGDELLGGGVIISAEP